MLAQICIFFWQITFSSVENTILVNSHGGKYSTLKKLKCACTEVYILQVENILSVENVIFVNSHRGVYYLDNFFSSVENTVLVDLYRGVYSSGRKHIQVKAIPLESTHTKVFFNRRNWKTLIQRCIFFR